LAECYKVGAALTYNILKWQAKGTFTAYLSAKCYKVSAEYAVPRAHIFNLDFIEFGTSRYSAYGKNNKQAFHNAFHTPHSRGS